MNRPDQHRSRSRSRKGPRAFTLLELLTVVAILSLLMAILLPALQSARRSGQGAACASNLHQLGIAMHGYHADQGALPPGRGGPLPLIFSAHAHLLPYMGYDAVADQIDWAQPPASFGAPPSNFDGTTNLPAASTVIPVLSCPADRGPRVPGSIFAGTSYAANAGSGETTLTAADGVFFTRSFLRLSQVRDGPSRTAAFSERLMGCGSECSESGVGDVQRALCELPGAATPTGEDCCGDGPANWNHERGAKWIVGNYGNTLYNHALPPNASEPDCTNATQQAARSTARSAHTGGVYVLLCDGSVQLIPQGITMDEWRALGTRDEQLATPP